MSTPAVEWVTRLDSLRGTTKAVLSAIAHRYSEETKVCYPGIERIAKDMGLSVSTVKRAVRRLEESGLIAVTRRPGNGFGRQTNVYGLPAYERQTSNAQPTGQREPLPNTGKVSDSRGQSVSVNGQGVTVTPKQEVNRKNKHEDAGSLQSAAVDQHSPAVCRRRSVREDGHKPTRRPGETDEEFNRRWSARVNAAMYPELFPSK